MFAAARREVFKLTLSSLIEFPTALDVILEKCSPCNAYTVCIVFPGRPVAPDEGERAISKLAQLLAYGPLSA